MHKETRDAVDDCLRKADSYYQTDLPRPRIRFDLKGRTAGQSHFAKGYLRFNIPLAQENKEDFIKTVVPHEVAHWVQRWRHGYEGVRPHGREWKQIMISVFGLSPKRTHKYDTTNTVTRRCRSYTYTCGCRTHELTSIRHNKIVRGRAVYSCPKCGMPLQRSQNFARKSLTSEVL